MKILLFVGFVILGVAGILVRLMGFLPWEAYKSQKGNTVRLPFLLGVGIFFLVVIFGFFWFAMRPR